MSRLTFAVAWAFIALASVAWTWLAGKDTNWDFLNYHFYGPYMLLEGRLGIDYFAASFQGYLNPLGYVPLYEMIRHGWHPLLIGTVLALLHSANFALAWLVTGEILPVAYPRKTLACSLALVLAFLSPLQLATLGGTFFDPISSLLILAVLYYLIKRDVAIGAKEIALSGLILGAVAGLKLTNLLMLPAAFAAIEAARGWQAQAVVKRLAIFSLAAAAGIFLTHGYWSFQLWREMGNPLFPLFNSVFHSPDFINGQYQDQRYLASGWRGIFTLPYEMLSHLSLVYSENSAADVRPIALCLALGALLIWSLIAHARPGRRTVDMEQPNAFRAVLVFTGTAYLAWAATSRIGRYAYVIWILVGPLFVAALSRLPGRSVLPVVTAVVIAVQLLVQSSTGNPRWTPTEYGDRWLPITVPDQLRNEPAAYFTITSLSYSSVIPYLHPRSKFANLVGQYVQPAGERTTDHLKRFMATDLPLKVLFAERSHGGDTLRDSISNDIDAILSSYGLKLSSRRCEFIGLKFDRVFGFNGWSDAGANTSVTSLASCDVERIPKEVTQLALAELARMDRIFDRAESACPRLLAPSGMQTLKGGKGWMRTYMNSNALLLSDGQRVFISQFKSISDIDLGPLSRWESDAPVSICVFTANPAG